VAQIVISEFMDAVGVDALRRRFDTLYDPHLVDSEQRLQASITPARALIVRNRTQVSPALLEYAPQLQCVGRLGVGMDNIDVRACRARGIAVYPATGANSLSVAEYVIAAVLVLLRGAFARSEDVASGRWPRQAMIGREASSRTLGLIGFGEIAQAVAQRAHGLGMTVAACDPHIQSIAPSLGFVQRSTLNDLLSGSDAVSLHTPLTPETRRMIDAGALRQMKQGSVLINTARGGIVDEAALAQALRSGHLGGAALDVFEEEPLSAVQGQQFLGLPNVLLTPHIAGVTLESNLRVSEMIADRVARHLGDGT
jgi:(S)-sulfolactate dehydrogenase